MQIIGDLCKYLKGNSVIHAKVGDRIYPSHLPESVTFPAIRIIQLGGSNPEPSHDSPGIYEILIQIDIYGKNLKDIVPVETELLTTLNGHRGDIFDSEVQGIFVEDSRMGYENEKQVEVISLDFKVILTI